MSEKSLKVIIVVLIAAGLALLAALLPPARASSPLQEETSAPAITGFWGRVAFPGENEDGVQITDVRVRFISEKGERYSVRIHQDGTYTIRGLPPGAYTIELDPPGFTLSYRPPYAVAESAPEEAKLEKGSFLQLDLGYEVVKPEQPPPTPTTAPTPLPILESGVDPMAYIQPGMEIRHIEEMDTDDDGQKEALLVNGDPSQPGSQVMVLDRTDGEVQDYYLVGDKKGVFSKVERITSLNVLDIEGDGASEIIVRGASEAEGEKVSFFFVFRWNGADYDFLEGLKGPGDFLMEDIDDDGTLEMLFREPADEGMYKLVSIYGWTGEGYEHSGEEYRCPSSASDAITVYYEAIKEGDYEKAFSFLSEEVRAGRTYEEFSAGFANTVEVRVLEKKVLPAQNGNWVERVTIEATDKEDDTLIARRFAVTWTVGERGGCPVLLKAYVEKLE